MNNAEHISWTQHLGLPGNPYLKTSLEVPFVPGPCCLVVTDGCKLISVRCQWGGQKTATDIVCIAKICLPQLWTTRYAGNQNSHCSHSSWHTSSPRNKRYICGFYHNYFSSIEKPSEADHDWMCRYLIYTKIFLLLGTLWDPFLWGILGFMGWVRKGFFHCGLL